MMNNQSHNQAVCYLCNILDEQTKVNRSIVHDSPAATKKVFDVCHALQQKFTHVYVVTMARGMQLGERKCFVANAKQIAKIPVLFARFDTLVFWTYWVSMVSIFCLVWRVRQKTKGSELHLISYNRNWLYVPSLIFSRLLGAKCYLDLEDGALVETSGYLARIRYLLIRFTFDVLCNHGSILVAPSLISQVNTKHNVVCYGVSQSTSISNVVDWHAGAIQFLLGGTLIRETGVLLLIDAVRILNRNFHSYKGMFIIYVTGYGDLADTLATFSQGEGRGWIEFKGRITKSQYENLLHTSHVGLCLKLPSCEMGATTFPSKVIEIATQGKLVLTTGLGCVSDLLGVSGACYLKDENPQTLANAIIDVVCNREASMRSATLGQHRVLELCSAEKVANDISRLFSGSTSS